MDLTPRQLDRMSRVMDTWSVMWDKRRSLWLAAEDARTASRSKRPTWTFC